MLSAAEKIETVVLARNSGSFGEYVALEGGAARVTVDGKTYIVKSISNGWSVNFAGHEFVGAVLYDVARNAAEHAKAPGGITRNYRIA